jgi:hypothetical protein
MDLRPYKYPGGGIMTPEFAGKHSTKIVAISFVEKLLKITSK